jgi:hypothetical protein
MRPRRDVPGWVLTGLRPFFRYSEPRRAYVLRFGGRRHGPVLRPEDQELTEEDVARHRAERFVRDVKAPH